MIRIWFLNDRGDSLMTTELVDVFEEIDCPREFLTHHKQRAAHEECTIRIWKEYLGRWK